ncbi:MAG TPA: hypothetical protein VHP58_00215 [Alphaproteobacteria bacterium]|nr:hypothetical protein [Alphaproteobacteria bacterium]
MRILSIVFAVPASWPWPVRYTCHLMEGFALLALAKAATLHMGIV